MPDPSQENGQDPDRPGYRGFDLSGIIWGYRDIYARRIDLLHHQGLLSPENLEMQEFVRWLIEQAATNALDSLVKSLLFSLHPKNLWILRIPRIRDKWVRLGFQFARAFLYMGERFFKEWGAGHLGDAPDSVEKTLDLLKELMQADLHLAYQFLKNCGKIQSCLNPDETHAFAMESLGLFQANREAGLRSLSLTLKSSRIRLQERATECRLDAIRPRLASLVGSIAGKPIDIEGINLLDSDFLLERATAQVCMYRWLYMPLRITEFSSAEANKNYYLLMASVSAACHAFSSFPCVQGYSGYSTSLETIQNRDLEPAPWVNFAFQLIEFRRVLRNCRHYFRGMGALLDWAVPWEFACRPAQGWPDILLRACLEGSAAAPWVENLLRKIDQAAAASHHFEESLGIAAREITPSLLHAIRSDEIPPSGLAEMAVEMAPRLRSVSFLPDFMYPAEARVAPDESLALDLHDSRRLRRSESNDRKADRQEVQAPDNALAQNEHREKTGSPGPPGEEAGPEDQRENPSASQASIGYFYEEWSQTDLEYLEDWCCVREVRPAPGSASAPQVDAALARNARKIRALFERLKPDEARRVKHLQEGDEIDIDDAIEFHSLKRAGLSPRARYYSRPFIIHRDMAVALLLDLSGSTNDFSGSKRVLDLEKEAAFILSEGLAGLGDQFAIYGFTGVGREKCEFHVLKDFQEPWSAKSKKCLWTAYPGSSTRIGPALRHCTWKMTQLPARKKLIILLTDGKPEDGGYDAVSGYAQQDVRKACQEALLRQVHIFCISTKENTRADLDTMFPRQRYFVVEKMIQLPALLSRFYLKLTA